MISLTNDGISMIVYCETGGQAYYDKFLQWPNWPVSKQNQATSNAGVTIGVGYDLGQEDNFETDWAGQLPSATMALLRSAVHLKGLPCRAKAASLKAQGVVIPWKTAGTVFITRTLPQNAALLERSYPGIQKLHPNAQASLLSMIYQWGATVRMPSQEAIRAAVARGDYNGIVNGLRSMKGHGYANRRELEARYALVGATQKVPPLVPQPVPAPSPTGPAPVILSGGKLAITQASPYSPYRKPRGSNQITGVVLHATGGGTLESNVQWFQNNPRSVSAHYVVGKDGRIVQVVPDNYIANQCKGANEHTIGIEHVANMTDKLTPQQETASAGLIRALCARWGISKANVTGHNFTPGYIGSTDCPGALFAGTGRTGKLAIQTWVASHVG